VVPFSKKSINLPGVAMTISTPLLSSTSWNFLGAPPYTQVFLICDEPPNLSHLIGIEKGERGVLVGDEEGEDGRREEGMAK